MWLTRALPYSLAYRVTARHETAAFLCGTLLFTEGSEYGEVTLENERFQNLVGKPITLVLEPAPDLMRDTIYTKYAAEPIELGPFTLPATE